MKHLVHGARFRVKVYDCNCHFTNWVEGQRSTYRLEQQLKEEKAARLNAEILVHDAQRKSDNEMHKLRESLERAEQELRRQARNTIIYKLREKIERAEQSGSSGTWVTKLIEKTVNAKRSAVWAAPGPC